MNVSLLNAAEDLSRCSPARWASDCIEICRADLDAISPAWDRLSNSGYYQEPFFQLDWVRAFLDIFYPNAQLVLARVLNETGVAGILPLVRQSSFFGGIPARALRSPSNLHSCRFDFIHDRKATSATWLLWQALRNQDTWDVIELLDVPDEGGFHSVMEHAAADGFLVAKWPTIMSPFIEIADGHDAEHEYPKSHRHFRQRLKGKLKKLKVQGGVRFERYTEITPRVLEHFLTLEGSGWKGKRGGAIASCEQLTALYRRLLNGASERGWCSIYSLEIEGKPIAMHLGLSMQGCYYAPKVAYDENLHKFSPGQLLVQHVIEDLRARKFHRYDFLGPCSRWKLTWTHQIRRHANCYIFRPGLKGKLLYAATMKGAAALRKLRWKIRGDPQQQALSMCGEANGADLTSQDLPPRP